MPHQRDPNLDVFCCNDNDHQVRQAGEGGMNTSNNRSNINSTNLGMHHKSGNLGEYPDGSNPYYDGDIEQPMGAVNIQNSDSMDQSEIRYQDPMLQQMQHNDLSRLAGYTGRLGESRYEADSILMKSHKGKYWNNADSRDNKVIEMKRIADGHS
jgi:hypothetical protein